MYRPVTPTTPTALPPASPTAGLPPRRWDLFCRVVDNFGDAGVCWRLAHDLASRGHRVRLWIDDAAPLAWMAPGATAGAFRGLTVQAFDAAADVAPAEVGDVVVEAFACDPPPAFVGAMAERAAAVGAAPVWLNLEYLSAEDWVDRVHGLPSPQRNGLTKWFFHPGFSTATGGLPREPGLLAERAAFEAGGARAHWLAAHGGRRPGERIVALFCYEDAPLPALLAALADRPSLLLLAAGAPQRAARGLTPPPGVRLQALPWLTQPDFDRLLWSADLAFVRGEDSLVRAVWAGVPFVWQIYRQHDGVHADKLEALLARIDAVAPLSGLRALWRAWNALDGDAAPAALPPFPDAGAWRAAVQAFRDTQAARTDLVTALERFAEGKSQAAC